MSERIAQIKRILEGLYRRYNRRNLIKPDPLQFVYRYSGRQDREIVAFLAAALAYGRVQQIGKSLTDLLGRMGESPSEFVRDFDGRRRKKLSDFKHRFTTGEDISDLLGLFRGVLAENGSIEKCFLLGYSKTDESVLPALSKFCDRLLGTYARAHGGRAPRGLKYLLAGPANDGACKRLNLFLRGRVRNDDVDTGLWTRVDKAKLIVPVDIHMNRLCRILGFHNLKTVSLAMAMRITEAFKEIEPADPVKYDFALSRIGIVKNCTGRHRSGCEFCELFEFCNKR
ncbi:MAG: TIGR02757 family protein [Sedimentisphaerales bacterium]|nr:TIGR02757 family protein [Sedimentisphaerales bacterium]